jgi:hypothetical protein
VDQDEQRALGVFVAEQLQAAETAVVIRDKTKCMADILATALGEKGLDVLVSGILQGPPQWAAETLRHVAHPGLHRDALAARAAEDPEAAFTALYYGADVGAHRDTLVAATADDPVWAHMTLREVPDLGGHREALLAAVAADPGSARFTLEQVADLGDHREVIAAAAAQAAT